MQKRGGRPRGLFADNIWKCDCNPRLPAENFKVKKEGKNKGRRFYTCQKQDPHRCGFFLWDEDAKPREATTVLSNRNSEVQQQQTSHHQDHQEGWDAGRKGVAGKGLFSSPAIKQEPANLRSPTLSPYDTPQSGSKRSRDSAGFDRSDDNNNWGLDDDDDNDLLRVADSYATPHKAQKMGVYATPATGKKSPRKLPWLEQPVSPPSSTRTAGTDHLVTPSKPQSSKAPDSLLGPPDSPSPQARFKDALVNPADSSSSLTSEILSHLSSISIPPEKLSTLRAILSRHDLKAQGVAKGRDISRLALKAKEARIVELQSKIVRLEAEREVDRGVIQKLRWDLQNSQTQDDGDPDDDEL